MKHFQRHLKGDTLIEVMLAIGIFSLVAISIVSIMSLSSSKAQNTLLTTMAREEIDNQAEAIRFIHDAYVSERGAGNLANGGTYTSIWREITSHTTNSDNVKEFAPLSCDALYSTGNNPDTTKTLQQTNAFILDTRNLSDQSRAVRRFNDTAEQSYFSVTSVYPRLLWHSGTTTSDDDLEGNSSVSNFLRAEGIYDVVVQGSGFYDFYIRTCWYSGDDNVPSTISTLVRLYDPAL